MVGEPLPMANIHSVKLAAFFWLRRAYAGSTPKPAKYTIDFDHVTAKRRARFIGICHVTGESNRRTMSESESDVLQKT